MGAKIPREGRINGQDVKALLLLKSQLFKDRSSSNIIKSHYSSVLQIQKENYLFSEPSSCGLVLLLHSTLPLFNGQKAKIPSIIQESSGDSESPLVYHCRIYILSFCICHNFPLLYSFYMRKGGNQCPHLPWINHI